MPPIPQVSVSPLALDTCRLIGANPAGPVGARLIEAWGPCPHNGHWQRGRSAKRWYRC